MLTWVPSKKALDKLSSLGVALPDDWQDKYNLPSSPAFAPNEVPFTSLLTLATVGYRHGMNNVIATAVLNARDAAEKEGTDFDASAVSHEKRMTYIARIFAGELGIRTSAPDTEAGLTPVEKNARGRAYKVLCGNAAKKGATGWNPEARLDVRILAKTLADGLTMGEHIDRLLSRKEDGSPRFARGAEIWAAAEKDEAEKAAQVAAAAEDDDLYAEAAE